MNQIVGERRGRMRVASIGECMVEFADVGGGRFARGFGGDTLNVALYLARLGADVSYVTALGDDPLSGAMIAAWQAEGIRTGEVMRLAGRMPGLYVIDRDARGERSFLYWRDRAPAREIFDRLDEEALERLSQFDWLYFSGISLSLYGEKGCERLARLLAATRSRGGRVAFDSNYRQRGWPDADTARRCFRQILPHVDLALPTFDDEQALFGDPDPDACAARLRDAGVREIVVKRGEYGCVVYDGASRTEVEPERRIDPVDTTAAGDSFNAAYLAARLAGAAPTEAARTGHKLAGVVISHPGAIIPRQAMPAEILGRG
jgi:2-dehydro-3-deoxygluconokinase